MKLTAKEIERLEPRGKRYIVWDEASDDLRFGVRVSTGGKKRYIVDFLTRDGLRRRMTMFEASRMPPREAKKEARRFAAEAAKGRDPIEVRRKAKHKGMKLSGLWEIYEVDFLDHPRPAARKGHKPLSESTRKAYRSVSYTHLRAHET